MKLRSLREHYSSTDGVEWRPKVVFNTKEEVIEAGFLPNKWRVYTCGLCGNLHIASVRKRKNNDE